MRKIFSVLLAMCMLAVNSLVMAATDISGGVITAEGIGAAGQATPLGYRAAQMDAYRQLLEQTNGVQITADTTVENYVTTSDVIRSRVSGLVRGAQVVNKFKDSDGFFHVVIELPVYGGGASLAAAVVPQVQQVPFKAPSDIIPVNNSLANKPMTLPAHEPVAEAAVNEPVVQTPIIRAPEPAVQTPSVQAPAVQAPAMQQAPAVQAPAVTQPQAVTPAKAASAANYQAAGNYTGVVVDCSGMGLQSAMAPAVFTPDHKVVYGLENFSRDEVVSHGYVGYSKSLTSGLDRAGSNPLVVKAVSIDRFCNPVVSDADAAKILAENKANGFLAKGSMVFVK